MRVEASTVRGRPTVGRRGRGRGRGRGEGGGREFVRYGQHAHPLAEEAGLSLVTSMVSGR